jgi:hypothetical protein
LNTHWFVQGQADFWDLGASNPNRLRVDGRPGLKFVFRSGRALSFGADHEAEISIKAAQFSRARAAGAVASVVEPCAGRIVLT